MLTAFAQALNFVNQALFARLYGKEAYGTFTSVWFTIEILCRGGAGGADKAMLRYVAAGRAGKDPEAIRRALGTGFRLHFLIAGGFSILLVVAAPWLGRLLGKPQFVDAWRVLAPLPLLVGSLWIAMQASLAARVTRVNFYTRGLAEPGFLLVAGSVAWWLGGGFRGLAMAYVVSYGATLALGIWLFRRVFAPEERHDFLRAPRVPGFARFALPVAAAEFFNATVQRADLLMLTALRGEASAGFYNVANVLTAPIANVRYTFDSILTGLLSEAHHLGDHERLVYNFRLVTRWVVSVATPITLTLIVLRNDLLPMIFSSEYSEGTVAVATLALSQFINATMGLTGWVLLATGRSHLGLINNLIAAAFNLPAAYFLTRAYGLFGASLTALGTVILLQGIMAVESYVFERVHPFSLSLLKPLLAALLAFLAQSALMLLVPWPWLRVIAVAVVGMLVYGGSLILFGLPDEERRLLARLLHKQAAADAGAAS